MSAILTQDLRKQYGTVKALDGLSITVTEGTVYGFLGPNGAGKSTTIRLLTGLAKPSSGTARVAGVDIANPRRLATEIGYLPEDPTFYGWMSPTEFLDHCGRIFGMTPPERRQRTKELLEQVGLQDAARRRIAGFSRGMRQRLGLAQALINKPSVLLLDEPASALDPAGRRDVLDQIAGLKSSCTVFMSTHILADVERVCDTIGIIDNGKLVVEAPQDELLSSYAVSAFAVEVEPSAKESLKEWIKALQGERWFVSASLEGTAVRITVEDVNAARSGLLKAAASADLPLRHFEVVTPSLEDIFLKLVGQEERP